MTDISLQYILYVIDDNMEHKLIDINGLAIATTIYDTKARLKKELDMLMKDIKNDDGSVNPRKFCNILSLYFINIKHLAENDLNTIYMKICEFITSIFRKERQENYQIYLRFKMHRRLFKPRFYCSYIENDKICCNEIYRSKSLCKYHNKKHSDYLCLYINNDCVNIITSYV